MKYKFFTGIDQSYSNTGIVILDNKGNVFKTLTWKTKEKDNIKRLAEFYKNIQDLISQFKDTIYAMEGYSYSKFNMAILGELGGVIKLAFYHSGIPITIYQPTVVKKFMCGTGNAKKELMLKQVYKKFGFDTDDDNLADAFAIARKLYEDNW